MQTRSVDYSINNHDHFKQVTRGLIIMIQQGWGEVTMIKKIKNIDKVYYALLQHFNIFVKFTNATTANCLSIENLFVVILRKDREFKNDIDKKLKQLHNVGFDNLGINEYVFHNLFKKFTNKSSRLIKHISEYFRHKYGTVLDIANYDIYRHILSYLYGDMYII